MRAMQARGPRLGHAFGTHLAQVLACTHSPTHPPPGRPPAVLLLLILLLLIGVPASASTSASLLPRVTPSNPAACHLPLLPLQVNPTALAFMEQARHQGQGQQGTVAATAGQQHQQQRPREQGPEPDVALPRVGGVLAAGTSAAEAAEAEAGEQQLPLPRAQASGRTAPACEQLSPSKARRPQPGRQA